MAELICKELTEKIIRSFFKVYKVLGYGFLEKVYENAFRIELMRNGLCVKQQQNIKVYYEGMLVGDYYTNLLVEDIILLELKAAESLCPENELQLINYLKATNIEVGLLMNFGKKAEYVRKIFTNDRKF